MAKKRKVFRKSLRVLHLGIWLGIGILIGMMVAGIYVSGTGNIKCFYNVGAVYDVPKSIYKVSGNGWIYDNQNRIFNISEQGAYKQISVTGKEKSWNFCVLDISDLTQSSVDAVVECFDARGVMVNSVATEFNTGRNWLYIGGPQFTSFSIRIPDGAGVQFNLNKLQLRNQNPDASYKEILKYAGLVFCVYVPVTLPILVWLRKKKISLGIDFYKIIEGLQKFYCKVANSYGRYLRGIPAKIREKVWGVCFLVLIFYSMVVIDCNQHLALWRYSQVVYTAAVLAIGLFSVEDEIKPVKWKNTLVYAWLVFWVFVCVSDFIVPKKFFGVGYIQIFVWGFCFLIWGNMKEPHRLMKAFMKAVHVSFWCTALFCILCRPESVGSRYMGVFINPNFFADYLVVVAAVVLTDITHRLLYEESKVNLLSSCVELLAALTFLWKTQTRGAMIAVGVLGILAAWYLVRESRKSGYRLLSRWVLYMMILLFPVYGAVSWGIATIPGKVGTTVVFENDLYKPAVENFGGLWEEKVYAAEKDEAVSQSRVIQSLKRGSLEEISSGRTLYWTAYMRKMNLWGHKWKAKINGQVHDAHNAWLAIAYRYGVFSLIPYLVMWGYSIVYAVKYSKNHFYGFLPLALTLGYMIVSLVDAAEQPYVNFIWFSMYFILGILFDTSSKDTQTEDGEVYNGKDGRR